MHYQWLGLNSTVSNTVGRLWRLRAQRTLLGDRYSLLYNIVGLWHCQTCQDVGMWQNFVRWWRNCCQNLVELLASCLLATISMHVVVEFGTDSMHCWAKPLAGAVAKYHADVKIMTAPLHPHSEPPKKFFGYFVFPFLPLSTFISICKLAFCQAVINEYCIVLYCKIREKYLSGDYYVKFGHFADF